MIKAQSHINNNKIKIQKHSPFTVIHVNIRSSRHINNQSNIVNDQNRKEISFNSQSSTIQRNKTTDSVHVTRISRQLKTQSSLYSNTRINSENLKTTKYLNQTDITNDYHRKLKKNEKKKCSQWRIFICLIISLFLIAMIVIAILLSLLMKPKKQMTNYEQIPGLRWNSTGITIAGITNVSGTASNLLNRPFGIAVDWSYTLYVVDWVNHRVQKFVRDKSNATTIAGNANGLGGSGLNALRSPTGILVDDNANIYVAESGNYRVTFWRNGATSGLIVAGNGTNGTEYNQLNHPYGLARNVKSNTLFTVEINNHRAMMYLYNASSGILIGGNNLPGLNKTQLSSPHSIFFDSLTNSVLIANTGRNNIVRWILGETEWRLVLGNANGLSGNTPSSFSNPTGVMLDPMDNIYVLDRYNQRVQFFPIGQTNGTTIAGIIQTSGINATLLNGPIAFTLDNQLNLYVADSINHRIQKFVRY